MDSSKSSISLMFCGSATGALLPPYVVYKAKNLFSEWIKGGPVGTRYNRSKNGWFDAITFEDWFEQTFVQHVKEHKLNEEGKVVIIGDNLSSHFSPVVLNLCQENNISFACLPKNSTHLTQPLDVAFYAPLKTFWRGILEKWKKGLQKKSQTVTKEKFPGLLNQLFVKIGGDDSQSNQLVSGFKKTRIVPYNPDEVISRLPGTTTEADPSSLVSESVLEMLKDLRKGESGDKKQRKSKLNIQPGRSIGSEDLSTILAARQQTIKTGKLRDKLRNIIKGKRVAKGKVTKKVGQVVAGKKLKKVGKATNKLGKENISVKAAVSDGESESHVITKNKQVNGRRKICVIVSGSENEEFMSKTEKKKRKVRASLVMTTSKKSTKKKSGSGKKLMNKKGRGPKILDSESDESILGECGQ